jgi:tetratricopeptide (TPR) repeat protein
MATHRPTDDLSVLLETVAVQRNALAAMPTDHRDRASVQINLAGDLARLFDRTGRSDLLAEGIRVGRYGLAAIPADDPRRATALNTLGLLLRRSFEQNNDVSALDEAIRLGREAAGLIPPDHPRHARYLSNLTIALRMLYERNGEPPVLAEAIANSRKAVAATPADHPAMGVRLANLSAVLESSYKLDGNPSTLIEAISVSRQALAAMPADDPNRGSCLHNLGLELSQLFERTGELPALREAVRLSREAVATTPAGHPRRALFLPALADSLLRLFERSSEPAILDEAVRRWRDALAATPADNPDRARYLAKLAGGLRLLFQQTNELELLVEAIRHGREALAVTPTGDDHRVTCLGVLGQVLQMLFRQIGDLDLLAEAIQVGREAVAAAAAGHPDRVGVTNDLALALGERAKWTGEPGTLTESVHLLREVLATTAAGDSDRAAYLHNLSIGLRAVFERTPEPSVLTEAIRLGREAVAATAAGHRDRAMRLDGLGSSLRALSEFTEELPPLIEAVDLGREAVAACAANQGSRTRYLANLAGSLLRLFERTDDLSALSEAVQIGRDVVAARPTGDTSRALHLSNLVGSLTLQYYRTGELSVLTEAIRLGREAVAAAATNDPNRAGCLANLASSLEMLFTRTHEQSARSEACDALAEASTLPTAPIEVRIEIGRRLAGIEMSTGTPQAALAALETAIDLLPQITPRALSRAARQHSLGRLVGLASDAAAVAVRAGRPERAVELLEQTRGLLLTEEIDDRGDLTELRRRAPALAAEFEELRAQAVVLADSAPYPSISGEDPRQAPVVTEPSTPAGLTIHLGEQRQRLAERWTALVDGIRATPGFAEFLRPPRFGQLQRQAADGPIVLVYTSRWGADALIVTPDPADPVHVVSLANLTNDAAHQQAARLQAACAAAAGPIAVRERGQQDVHTVLRWLWDTIASPVLDRLSITGGAGPAPRIWWCPVGVLAYLPIHAAGHHTDPSNRSRTVLDRVVSSYLITIRALQHARGAHAGPSAPDGSTILIAMPTTPGAAQLPGVLRETTALAGLLQSPLTLTGPTATHRAVADALPQHQIAHFACHGFSDWADPAASRLLLHDHTSAPLTVTTLARLHLTNADLAYLSACSTSRTSPMLVDEAVHLTAAVHIAGYRQVIGTLWPVGDTAARLIATDVYSRLTGTGSHPPRPAHAARALNDAIRSMRDEYPAVPTRWAAHLHLGA